MALTTIKSIKDTNGVAYGIQTYNNLTIGTQVFNGSSAVEIKASDWGLSNAMHWRGIVTATSVTDALASTVVSNPSAGDVFVIHDSTSGSKVNGKDYVYNGSSWEELGDENSYVLKGTYGVTTTGTASTNVKVSDHKYTPQGTVTTSFTGSNVTVTASNNAVTSGISYELESVTAPSASISITNGTKTVTANGTISGTAATSSVTFTPSTVNLIPAVGTASAPTFSVATSTADSSCLEFTWKPGSVLTQGSQMTVWNGCTATAAGQAFSGTTTMSGTVSVATAAGITLSSVNLSHTHTIQASNVKSTASYTPAGSVTSTFTGTPATLSHTVTQGTVSATASNGAVSLS